VAGDFDRDSENESDRVSNDYPDAPGQFEKAMLWVLAAILVLALIAILFLPR